MLKYWLLWVLMVTPELQNFKFDLRLLRCDSLIILQGQTLNPVYNFKNQNCFPIDVDILKCVVHSYL